jgi:uncharacterized membrane protein YkgB
MDRLFGTAQELSTRALRLSMGVALFWIGALKFADPTPVVGLLEASFAFLAFPAFVYLLGVVEVAAAVLLFAGVAVRWVGLLLVGLFSGTLAIFVIAPAVSYGPAGFPFLSLAGEFLLKDLVLFSVGIALAGTEPATMPATAALRVRAAE